MVYSVQKYRFLASCYRLAEAQFDAYPNFQTVSEGVFSETEQPHRHKKSRGE
jgi:hypothetical protein